MVDTLILFDFREKVLGFREIISNRLEAQNVQQTKKLYNKLWENKMLLL